MFSVCIVLGRSFDHEEMASAQAFSAHFWSFRELYLLKSAPYFLNLRHLIRYLTYLIV